MYGFEWQDQRGVEGTGFVRALRSLLTSNLPHFQPTLETIIRDSFSRELGKPGADGERTLGYPPTSPVSKQLTAETLPLAGFAHVQVFPFIKKTVTEVNSFIFFGEELCKLPRLQASLQSRPWLT